MTPFQSFNARQESIDEMLRVDTGREKQGEILRQALFDSRHNVIIYGSRGTGKTFFMRTQAVYLATKEKRVFSLYIPVDIRFLEADTQGFAHHILNTLLLECWTRLFDRPKSDLLRLSTLDAIGVLDGLKPAQERYISLYQILNSKQFNIGRSAGSKYGVSAIADIENKRDATHNFSRNQLFPSEMIVVIDELGMILREMRVERVFVHLDEIEMSSRGALESGFISFCMGVFNPIGVQFVVAGVSDFLEKRGDLFGDFETIIELFGLAGPIDLGAMIEKYSRSSKYVFGNESIAILYEFFGGHPRISLGACVEAIEIAGGSGGPIAPRTMTKACLNKQEKVDAWMRAIPSR